jgi:hypothetical protein
VAISSDLALFDQQRFILALGINSCRFVVRRLDGLAKTELVSLSKTRCSLEFLGCVRLMLLAEVSLMSKSAVKTQVVQCKR